MKKNIFVLILFVFILNSCNQTNVSGLSLNVSELTLEYMDNPIGIDSKQPLLSWQIQSNGRSVLQSAYEIRVSKNAETLSKNRQLVWQTGKVSSSASLHHVYDGESLESGQKYYWQVRVWDTNANDSEWSDVAYWQMGLVDQEDWKAKWIGLDVDYIEPADDHRKLSARMVRREFNIEKKNKVGHRLPERTWLFRTVHQWE
jgi:alpha-L-rhamnosidase